MGHKFSMVLSREITNDESATLLQAGCGNTIFAIHSLPSDADVPVTKMDFDDTVSEAIGAAFEAVKKVSDLSLDLS